MGFASHYMAYSVPSTSTWCHLGGSYVHSSHVYITFCKRKAYNEWLLVLYLGKLEVIVMDCLAGTNGGSGRKRKDITSLAKRRV